MSHREFFAYDGTTCIGRFVVDQKTGAAKAFDAAGKSLGRFPNYDAAREAVNQAQARKAATRRRESVSKSPSGSPLAYRSTSAAENADETRARTVSFAKPTRAAS
jgi:hypothetical protein